MNKTYPITPDSQLWNEFREGSDMAFQKIFSDHVQAMFKYGSKFTNQEELVKDCIQELFVSIHEKRSNLGDTNNIRLYLFIALKRKLFDHFKKPANKKSVELTDEHFKVEFIEEEIGESENTGLRETRILEALNNLTPRQKEVIYLRFIQELSYEDICELMDMNYQSVRNLVHRSIEKLRGLLTKNELMVLLILSMQA